MEKCQCGKYYCMKAVKVTALSLKIKLANAKLRNPSQ